MPGVLYGPEIKAVPIEVQEKEFQKIYQEAGESSLILLEGAAKGETLVLIHDIKKDPLTGKPIHVDFYKPILTKEVKINIPLVFEGESMAVRDLGGTLIKNLSEIEVSALPQHLPHEIKVDIERLKTFEDQILIKDLKLPAGAKSSRQGEEIVATVIPPEKIEEELAKPIEEKVEEVEKITKEKEPDKEADSQSKSEEKEQK